MLKGKKYLCLCADHEDPEFAALLTGEMQYLIMSCGRLVIV